MHCKIIKISAYELLVEEGTRMNKPIEKLIFKHAVASIEDRRER
jgi:sRNA-binding regulator protein Hfq